MEFLGDSVLQFVVSVYLFRHFPEHHEGHLTVRLAEGRIAVKALWEFITRFNWVGNKLSKRFFSVFISLINNSVVLSQLLRSSLVNHRIQATLARELGLDKFINFGGQVSVSLLSPRLTGFHVFIYPCVAHEICRHSEIAYSVHFHFPPPLCSLRSDVLLKLVHPLGP